jgi:hypothetical protein
MRLTGDLPALEGEALAWWVWRVMFWMFVATGLPITVWQIWQSRTRLSGIIRYLTRRLPYEDPADQAPTLAQERGPAAATDD